MGEMGLGGGIKGGLDRGKVCQNVLLLHMTP